MIHTNKKIPQTLEKPWFAGFSFVQLIVTLESYYNVEFPDEKLSIEVAGIINKLTTIVDEILTNR